MIVIHSKMCSESGLDSHLQQMGWIFINISKSSHIMRELEELDNLLLSTISWNNLKKMQRFGRKRSRVRPRDRHVVSARHNIYHGRRFRFQKL